jgi:peptidoglycan/LPS O-acetylase OafA/YrhL
MEKQQQLIIIVWMKRLAGVSTILVWLYVMYIFVQEKAPFAEIAPYCMGSTMLIFGVLSTVFKGLEYWEKNILKENK